MNYLKICDKILLFVLKLDSAKHGSLTKEIDVYKGDEVVGIVIICNDPRANLWKPTKAQLIPKGKIFAPIMVFGGAIPLVYPEDLATDHHCLLGQIHFGLGNFPTVSEFLVVTHDCGYYNRIRKGFTLEVKMKDGKKIADFLERHFNLPATVFFAHTRTQGEVCFEKSKAPIRQ